MRRLVLSVSVAAILWFVMFSPWTSRLVNFWVVMGFAAALLILMSALFDDDFRSRFSLSPKDLYMGLLSAALLYGVFFLGDYLSSLLFDFARAQVNGIYLMKEGENPVVLGFLLAFLIGPAEEIFWRGFVQRSLEARYGKWRALLWATLAYTLVHLWSFNFMLIMAALVCGLFWGMLYIYGRSITALVISHALWDVAVFVLFPIV